jgi:hypothetical protein
MSVATMNRQRNKVRGLPEERGSHQYWLDQGVGAALSKELKHFDEHLKLAIGN